MIKKQSEVLIQNCFNTDPVLQKVILPVSKMKMREKTKFKTVEEISLLEFDSQVQDKGQLIVVIRFSKL